MPPEVMARLHGAIRSLRPAAGAARPRRRAGRRAPAAPTRALVGPGADARFPGRTRWWSTASGWRRGSRVRLRPRPRGTDAHDMFLAGRTARVEGVFRDVDDARHVAVTLEDPSQRAAPWYGRYHYFAPEEVEPLAADGSHVDDAPDGAGAAGRRAMSVLVAGIGNVFLGDDGFGVEVVRRLDPAAVPDGVDVADYGIRGIHLAYELLDGRYAHPRARRRRPARADRPAPSPSSTPPAGPAPAARAPSTPTR